jgi:hypothetical protein
MGWTQGFMMRGQYLAAWGFALKSTVISFTHTHPHSLTLSHIHAHTFTHTQSHSHTLSHIHAHTLTLKHSCSHTHTLTLTHSCSHIHSHSISFTHTLTHSCSHSHSRIHVHTHALTLIHSCSHIHSHSLSRSLSLSLSLSLCVPVFPCWKTFKIKQALLRPLSLQYQDFLQTTPVRGLKYKYLFRLTFIPNPQQQNRIHGHPKNFLRNTSYSYTTKFSAYMTLLFVLNRFQPTASSRNVNGQGRGLYLCIPLETLHVSATTGHQQKA